MRSCSRPFHGQRRRLKAALYSLLCLSFCSPSTGGSNRPSTSLDSKLLLSFEFRFHFRILFQGDERVVYNLRWPMFSLLDSTISLFIMCTTSILSDGMEYIAALTDRINFSDSESLPRPPSPLNGKSGRQIFNVCEANIPKACQRTYFKTVRLRGRYDGPCDNPKEHVDPALAASTLPCRHSKAAPRACLKALLNASSSRSISSLRSPDRFLPQRPALNSASQSYRINRDPESLSTLEKLLRNNKASPDAFSPRRNVTISVPEPSVVPSLPNGRRFNAAGRREASVLTFQHDLPLGNGNRHVSIGTVWTVGGLAQMNVGRPATDGRPLGTGTNAPLYTTSFSTVRPRAEEELEKHESRLAEALQVDRVTRVLEFRDPSMPLLRLRETIRKIDLREKKAVWKGTEWIMSGLKRKVSLIHEVCAFTSYKVYLHQSLNLRFVLCPLLHSKFWMPRTFVTIFTALFWRTLLRAIRSLLG